MGNLRQPMFVLKPLALAAVLALLFAGCTAPAPPTTEPVATTQAGATTPGPAAVTTPATAPTTSAPAPDMSTGPYQAPAASVTLSGSGSTFVKPLVEAWAIQFANSYPAVQVSYGGGGSGKGISDITGSLVAFAGTDAPLQPSDRAKAPGLLMFPETIGPVAIVYNVAGIQSGLHLTGEVLGRIYAGSITVWNDPAIAALNPGMSLPATTILTVHRSDSSGTTYVFTDYLGHASANWSALMGAAPSKSPAWTRSSASQLAGNANDGVSTTVSNNAGAIGYVDMAYAVQLSLNTAAIQNPAGEWSLPSSDGASKAAASVAGSLPTPDGDWSHVTIVNSAAPGAYPISSFTYLLVYNSTAAYGGKVSGDQMAALKAWMWWDLHGGQADALTLYYAPLPDAVVHVGESALAMIH
ncbi:MAG: phosphate ABC transporter substrate-binding protein PstS [Thermoplasmatota archaeon]